jgi:hypothetical protein
MGRRRAIRGLREAASRERSASHVARYFDRYTFNSRRCKPRGSIHVALLTKTTQQSWQLAVGLSASPLLTRRIHWKRSKKPDIGISYLDAFDSSLFDEAAEAIAADGLKLRIESRPDPGPYASLEWLVPTAVFAYIAKSYFDSFLKEAGKDHYGLLKAGLSTITSKLFGSDAPATYLIFTKGKAASSAPKYSLTYSVIAEIGGGIRVKLLLRNDCGEVECNEAQLAFLKFLSDLHDGLLDVSKIDGLVEARPVSNTLLLEFDKETQRLRVVDPLPKYVS